MYDDGYKNIVNIDVRTKSFDRADSLADWGTQYSPVVIERMRARNHNRPEMQCVSVPPVIFT